MSDDFEKVREQLKSNQKKGNPKDKILLNEATELLKHCEEEDDFGSSHNPAKLDLRKFIFLKNIKNNGSVNKYLIRLLTLISDKNILLRYLLIEAGLRNSYIEKLLQEGDFYNISNDPEDFYFKNNVPNELKFSNTQLKIKLQDYSILTPEESSYLIISKKTEEIANKLATNLVENLQSKMENAFRVLIYSNKNKNKNISDHLSPKILKTETDEDLKKYFEGIKSIHLYWSKSLVEAEFSKKTHSIDGSFINYLNQMFWLNDEKYQVFIEAFFNFPNLLVELYDKHQQGAGIYFEKFADYIDLVELDKKNKELQIAKLKGANETYQKALEDKQEEQRKKIDNMIKFYVDACKKFKTDNPTREMLSEISGLSANIWKHNLANSKFLYPLSKSLEEVMNYSKNEQEFWRKTIIVVEKKLSNVLGKEKILRGGKSKDGGSKQKRIKAEQIKSESKENRERTHQCNYCEQIIPIEQELCKECKELFPSQ